MDVPEFAFLGLGIAKVTGAAVSLFLLFSVSCLCVCSNQRTSYRKGSNEGYQTFHSLLPSRTESFMAYVVFQMSRAELVKADKGVAIEMTSPLYDAPSMNSAFLKYLSLLE